MSRLDLFQLHPSANTANACRHFIATTGDMVGASRLDNVFLGEGMAGEIKLRWKDWGKLFKFEGRHFPSMSNTQG